MADWFDSRIGDFCGELQKQIDEIPFLTPWQRQQYLDMLEEYANKADSDMEDSISYLRREVKPMAEKFSQRAGKFLKLW